MGIACSRHGGKGNACRILVGSQKERDHLEDLHIGGRIILNLILERQDGVIWTGVIWLMIRTSGGLL
jgi:hypothetical protein